MILGKLIYICGIFWLMANNCYSTGTSITNYSLDKDGELTLFENVRGGPSTEEISEQSKAYLDDSYVRLSEAISSLSNLNYEKCFSLQPEVVDTDILCMPFDSKDLSLNELMRYSGVTYTL